MTNIGWLFKVFEPEHDSVSLTHGQDKAFLYMAGEIVTMALNQANQQVKEILSSEIAKLITRFRITFAALLVDAEDKKQPKRLDYLKQLWYAKSQ